MDLLLSSAGGVRNPGCFSAVPHPDQSIATDALRHTPSDADGASNPWRASCPTVNSLLFAAVRPRPRFRKLVLSSPIVTGRSGWLVRRHRFMIGSRRYTLPGTRSQTVSYAKLEVGRRYEPGEVLADGFMTLGDHLFVERLSMYLAPPHRGDVIVFNTEGLEYEGRKLMERSGYYYIKRLAALPGDTVKLADNQLWVRPAGAAEFRKIQELAPAFAKVYSGSGYQGTSGMDGEIRRRRRVHVGRR